MKKLSILLIYTLASGLMLGNVQALGFNFCNFFLEHDKLIGCSGSLKGVNDKWTITPTESLDVDVSLNGPPGLTPLSGLIDEDENSENLDGFDLNLMQFPEKTERLKLNFKLSRSDLVYIERNDY